MTFDIDELRGNPFATPRALRESAIKWQLWALGAQAKAIKAIAQEHNINLQDLHPEALLARAEDLARTAGVVQNAVADQPLRKTLTDVAGLQAVADQLKRDVSRFVNLADQRAHFRLSSLLPVLCQPENAEDGSEQVAESAVDEDRLAVEAAANCYRAESEQHGTFALQIHSICDLSMEMVLAAASEAASQKENEDE